MLPHLNSHARLATLKHNGVRAVQLWAQECGCLHLHQSAELGVKVLKHVVALVGLLNQRVAPRHTNVVGDSHVRLLPTAHAYLLLVLGVDDVEDLLVGLLAVSVAVDGLEDDVVALGLVNVNDVHEAVAVRDRERKELFAQLAVQLLELDHHLPLVHLHRPLGLQPALQTLQVDRRYGPRALARGDQWVEGPVVVHLL